MSKEVINRIKKIEDRLAFLEKTIKRININPTTLSQTININDMLNLPSSLQKTMLAIQELEEATASEVAEKTKRDRTVETIYLNQLTRLGYLDKARKSRKVYFKTIRYY